jgi:rhodanese-related sulfurtransferase
MKKYNKDGVIVVYCRGDKCEVSIDLAYEIARLGFNSVNIYRGGIKEWKEKGFPTQP